MINNMWESQKDSFWARHYYLVLSEFLLMKCRSTGQIEQRISVGEEYLCSKFPSPGQERKNLFRRSFSWRKSKSMSVFYVRRFGWVMRWVFSQSNWRSSHQSSQDTFTMCLQLPNAALWCCSSLSRRMWGKMLCESLRAFDSCKYFRAFWIDFALDIYVFTCQHDEPRIVSLDFLVSRLPPLPNRSLTTAILEYKVKWGMASHRWSVGDDRTLHEYEVFTP